ncbi:hypothetical protein, partial [uncultured Polaribacter sp.]|uniref:hypothetical protein n=1 Tax=uncultured Polaribacter sp. TaxID=174711 RepID=UPI00260A3393
MERTSTFVLEGTAVFFEEITISSCVVQSSNIRIEVTAGADLEVDYLNLFDADGDVSCSPNVEPVTDFTFTEPAAFIPIAQGFFIGSDSDGGTVTFNNSQREYVVEGTESIFFKSNTNGKTLSKSAATESFRDLPVLKLGLDYTESGINLRRQAAVSFSNITSFGYDKGYDAEIFDINSTDFYWKFTGDDAKYIITGV